MAITINENSDYVSMERFVPNYNPAKIIDIKFSPNGNLYILKYGSRWFQNNKNDKLVRIEYNAGNRTPAVMASANKKKENVPLSLMLSGEGSIDYDGDPLTYT